MLVIKGMVRSGGHTCNPSIEKLVQDDCESESDQLHVESLFRKHRKGVVLPSAASPVLSLLFREQCIWQFLADHVR